MTRGIDAARAPLARRFARLAGCAVLASPGATLAHAATPASAGASAWPPAVVVPLVAAAALYATGWLRLRSRGGGAVSGRAAACFAAGLTMLALALLSPLDGLGGELFAFHMVQHELIMVVAAPLLVSASALPVLLWAFPGGLRRTLAQVVARGPIRRCFETWTRALPATCLYGAVLWLWHAPPFFDAALRLGIVHDLQHLSFLGASLLFWTAIRRSKAAEAGAAVLASFATTTLCALLGALVALAGDPWYAGHGETSARWGIGALEDQQLGGFIMWMPGSLPYVLAGLVALVRWMDASAPAVPVATTALPADRPARLAARPTHGAA